MSKPSRPSDPGDAQAERRTFFVTSRTSGGRSIFQTGRMAGLLIDVLRESVHAGRFVVYDFVVMPNHVHILLSVGGDASVEKAVQWIKGGFSFRAGKELGFKGEIWQRGFSDERVWTAESFAAHRAYIEQNPVRAGLATAPEAYPYGSAYFKKQKHAGAKAPESVRASDGTTEVVP
jgi:putative transposase